ncbi:MAG: cyclodeaminase/cyclohydrolase family protein [Chloroflexi bacterium]|nr:cyclodeaminase/cyclohydrolase family protein [Chloroflexota bacterium]
MTDPPTTSMTQRSCRQFAAHVSSRNHAMAGATIAVSAALACSLGEVCVRINAENTPGTILDSSNARLNEIRLRLLDLADQDGAAITLFAALRKAGQELQGQDKLCQLPVEMGQLSIEAAELLQSARPLIQQQQDDLEMAIRLLDGAARASYLLLDSNLRIWPEPELLSKYEPLLSDLRNALKRLQAVDSVRATEA